jgi:hypothetical protein
MNVAKKMTTVLGKLFLPNYNGAKGYGNLEVSALSFHE